MVAYHSLGGMTLTIPDFIPYLSILSMNFLKLRNWSIVYNNKSATHCTQRYASADPAHLQQALHRAAWWGATPRSAGGERCATYRLEDGNLSTVPVMVRLDLANVLVVVKLELRQLGRRAFPFASVHILACGRCQGCFLVRLFRSSVGGRILRVGHGDVFHSDGGAPQGVGGRTGGGRVRVCWERDVEVQYRSSERANRPSSAEAGAVGTRSGEERFGMQQRSRCQDSTATGGSWRERWSCKRRRGRSRAVVAGRGSKRPGQGAERCRGASAGPRSAKPCSPRVVRRSHHPCALHCPSALSASTALLKQSGGDALPQLALCRKQKRALKRGAALACGAGKPIIPETGANSDTRGACATMTSINVWRHGQGWAIIAGMDMQTPPRFASRNCPAAAETGTLMD